MVSFCDIHYSMTFIILSKFSVTILIIVMMIMKAQLLFILLDQEKSKVLSSGISKDLEIGSSKGTGLYRLLVCVYCYNG